MKLKDFLDNLRQEFDSELSTKTGWGRVEVKQAFERAVSSALAKNMKLE